MPTLAEVAKHAHVSKTTASRVLNGLAEQFRITPATVALVEAAAQELGYRPSYAARALTRGRTDNIGLLLGSHSLANPASQPYVASVLGGINEIIRPKGLHVVLASEHDRYRTLGFEGDPSDRFDALIAFGYVLGPNFTMVDVEHLSTPLVVIGESPVPTQRPVVCLGAESGLEAAVEHLYDNGHRSIVWASLARPESELAHRPGPDDAQTRARAMVHLAQQRGMECSVISAGLTAPLHHLSRDVILRDLCQAFRPALMGLASATAICCYNDMVAHAILRVLRTLGRRVPQDISVIGFDNLIADIADPPLTTIDHRLNDMGRRAAEIALEMIEGGPAARERFVNHREVIPARLIVRDSTAAAMKAVSG